MNNAYASSKKPIDPEVVDVEIRRILKEVFLDVLRVERTSDGRWWLVSHAGWPGFGCSVALIGQKKVQFRRASTDEFAGWVQNVLQCSVAKKLGGKVSDEGIPGQRDPDREYKPTWKSYFDMVFGHAPKQAAAIWKAQVAQLPEDLRKLAEQS